MNCEEKSDQDSRHGAGAAMHGNDPSIPHAWKIQSHAHDKVAPKPAGIHVHHVIKEMVKVVAALQNFREDSKDKWLHQKIVFQKHVICTKFVTDFVFS